MPSSTSSLPAPAVSDAADLLHAVIALRAAVARDAGATFDAWRPHVTRHEFVPGAHNLALYLALRRHDLSELQEKLACWGVSSLGRSESRVLSNLDAVAATLAAIAGEELPGIQRPGYEAYRSGARALRAEKRALFGVDPDGPKARILVTLPAEAASDSALCAALIEHGADCARINCAHDGPDVWRAMAANMRAAAAARGRSCAVLMDLGGPKLRIERVLADAPVRLKTGDRFMLLAGSGHDSGVVGAVFSEPRALEHLRVGHSVWIDDGKIGCIVERVDQAGALLRITASRGKGHVLKAAKGVNFPETRIEVPALTAKDRVDLDCVVELADMVGYSFVQRPDDVALLQRELEGRAKPAMPIVLKIETRLAVENLPRLIVAAAGRQPTAVMLARGDLAVEVGFRRLAEIQEEILWMCEAARVPVIWATQVLERLVRKGELTRAEATDAAMSQRAECVMLNKGPHLAEAVQFLDDVLRRMDRHQTKKTSRMSLLHSWQGDQSLKFQSPAHQ
ncbi:MAG: pyruvate kinase [Burkholderiales bacterium]